MEPNLAVKEIAYLEQNKQEAGLRRDRLLRSFGGPWQFNEIVGYVRLHFVGSQIRGALWMVEKKRIKRTRAKQLFFQTNKVVPELDIPRQATNQEVYATILKYLKLTREMLHPRFVDTSMFERLGRFLDWNGMRQEKPLGIDP